MGIFFVLAILTIVFLVFLNLPTPTPVFNVYRQPDKWYYIKTTLFYGFLKVRELVDTIKNEEDSGELEAEIKWKKEKILELECSKELMNHPQAYDGVYFNGADKDGYFLATSLFRRHNGILSGYFYIKIPHIGLLESMKLPDTMLFQDSEEKSMQLFSAEGIHFAPLKPLRKWKISFHGLMRVCSDPKEVIHIQVDAIWTTNLSYFDVVKDMDPMLLAKIYAKEPWSKEFFEIVDNFHNTHYGQHGYINGTVAVNGEIHKLKLNSLKSRSYGVLRLSHMHRYVIHSMTFGDGTSITLGVISIPVLFSSKEYGYIYYPNGKMSPITFCSLKLQHHGEKGTPPRDYSFTIKAGGKTYHIQVQVLDSAEFFVGWRWEARFVECQAKFNFNGNMGWGGIQWHYRHVEGRPESITNNDPEWTIIKRGTVKFPLFKAQDYEITAMPFAIDKI